MPQDHRSFIRNIGIMLGSLIVSASLSGCEPAHDLEARRLEERARREAVMQAERQEAVRRIDALSPHELEDFRAFDKSNSTSAIQNSGPPYAQFLAPEVQRHLAAKRRAWYVQVNSNLPPVIRDAILRGTIQVGMTAEQVQASWGWPLRVNRTVAQMHSCEQWIYREVPQSLHSRNTYLYFDNGVLTGWQD